jgi:hypothetical protein
MPHSSRGYDRFCQCSCEGVESKISDEAGALVPIRINNSLFNTLETKEI